MLKVSIRPSFAGPDKGEGGIRRWVEAQHRYLEEFDIDSRVTETDADVIVCHAGDLARTTKPLVAHNHGLYATGSQTWSRWEWSMNQNVIELARRADITTVPSRWVAQQLARGMSLQPRILYAGIEPTEWPEGEDGGYVLWNKTRVDNVCDPEPMNRLARRSPKQEFISTFGDPSLTNLRRTGRLPYAEAAMLLRNAAVFLSTSRETFGIATVEAQASGVPVLGWAWGGNLDIVNHLETGYLAIPGDMDDLVRGLAYCRENRARLGAAARERALGVFTWRRAAEECADLYREAYQGRRGRPKVSVIVTVYNLEQYLPDCLRSLQAQTFGNWEAIVVDDCSPGPCQEIVDAFAREDGRIKYQRTPQNLYLAGARNHGIERSGGEYVIPLDADDRLNERSLEVLANFLDEEPGVAIAYGAFELEDPDGKRWISGWPRQFVWEQQIEHKNQLPYASLYRRWVWERTGGYRERCRTAEDADFWCRVTSYGARPQRVTDYPTLLYRNRNDSMSHEQAEPDWTAWYPWAADRSVAPFGNVGKPSQASWPVRTFTEPRVSVIIPVGPGHERVLVDALDSVAAQTMPEWEAIVVNDTGKDLALTGFPWARVVNTEGKQGPAIARNLGLTAATAPLVAFLDADDWFMPTFLDKALAVQAREGGYVYSDWFQVNGDGTWETKATRDYDMMALMHDGLYHAITGVYPTAAARDLVGGFDPTVGGWEDWDFVFALATQEVCGTRLAEPLWCYRFWSGQRREDGIADGKANAAAMRRKWATYIKQGGKKLMGCRGCGHGGGKKAPPPIGMVQGRNVAPSAVETSDLVLIEYVGAEKATRTWRGAKSQTLYRFGADEGHRRKFVLSDDCDFFLSHPDFKRTTLDAAREAALPTETEPLDVRQDTTRIAAAV